MQICNALSKSAAEVETWLKKSNRWESLLPHERNPETLHKNLQTAFDNFFSVPPKELNDLADFINEQGNSNEDIDEDSATRRAACGWCPETSWHESYLFAVELVRILQAPIDIMEIVEMMQIACRMQLLRSLAAQSYRYAEGVDNEDGLVYRLLFSEIEENNNKPDMKYLVLPNCVNEDRFLKQISSQERKKLRTSFFIKLSKKIISSNLPKNSSLKLSVKL